MIHDHVRALDVVKEVKALGGADNPAAYFLYYVAVKAWQALGRADEVDRILAVLEEIDNPLTAPLLTDLRGGAPE